MRKIISIMLTLIVLASLPMTAIAQDSGATTKLDNSGGLIEEVNSTPIENAEAGEVKDIGTRMEADFAAPADMKFTAEDFDNLSRDEIVAMTKDTLHQGGLLELEAKRAMRETKGLADLSEATDPKLVSLYNHKQESRERVLEAQSYGKKLANGEIEAAKSDEKYTVVDNVILISTEEELASLHQQEGYFRLVNDITLVGAWEPIDFYGTLEGGGYQIVGATMDYVEYDLVGFFSTIGPEAVVQNLTLVYPYVRCNASSACFCAYNQGTISNCHVESGTVIPYMWTSYDYAFWDISAAYIGGLVATNEGYIFDSSFTGDIDGWTVCGGLCGENYGYIFASYALANVCYELNQMDYDIVGSDYYYNYGYEEYPLFATGLRFQWAALILMYCEAVGFGYNGGLVGINYYYILDSCVQGYGTGVSYSLGAVVGFDCVGGLVGADAGYIAHCYSVDRGFLAMNDGAELYFPWDYYEEGGIIYDYSYFAIHIGIGWTTDNSVTDPEAELFVYANSMIFPCEDGYYHGTMLTADEFLSPSTYSNWNNAEWNTVPVWIFIEGYYPVLSDCPILPTEWVISYEIGNSGGMLDGSYISYKIAQVDMETGLAEEPIPARASNCANGYGISYWTPTSPYRGKEIGSDMAYVAFFDRVSVKLGDANLDNRVNTADAVELLRYTIGMTTLSYPQRVNGDATLDGYVNTGDAVEILRYTVGLVTLG